MQPLGALVLTLAAAGVAVFVVHHTDVALLQLLSTACVVALGATTIGFTSAYVQCSRVLLVFCVG